MVSYIRYIERKGPVYERKKQNSSLYAPDFDSCGVAGCLAAASGIAG